MRRTGLVFAGATLALVSVLMGFSGVAVAKSSHDPTIKAVVPDHGSVDGGTTVTITGKYLVGATAVDFGGVPAESFSPVSNSAVTAVSPPGTGTVAITVTTPVATTALVPADEFTYVTTPAIQNVRPSRGASTGENRVTITGSDFTGATAVDFGSVAATSFVIDSDQAITAVSPAGAVGPVNVTVIGPDGESPIDPADTFTYVLKVPKVTSVAPDVGPAGTTVTITGTGFTHVTGVQFDGTPASYVPVNRTTISAVSPAGSGTEDVTVTTTAGTSTIVTQDEYTYPSD
jgi:hypothetical protein